MRDKIIQCAKTYVGTPYHHQGRVKGAGIDCCGLIICVAKDLNLSSYDTTAYSRSGDGIAFLEEFSKQLTNTNNPQPGDILCFRVLGNSHSAILSLLDGQESLIHSYSSIRRVVEHRLDETWRRKIVAAFKFPGV